MPDKDKTWEEVGNTITGDNGRVRDAFKNGMATKVFLKPAFKLYKFNQYKTLTAPGIDEVSPSWSPYEAYEWDPGWNARKKMAADLHVNLRELGRVTSSIKENWNSLSYLLVIQVQKGAYGYFGGFAQMTRLDVDKASKRDPKIEASGGTKNLPGGRNSVLHSRSHHERCPLGQRRIAWLISKISRCVMRRLGGRSHGFNCYRPKHASRESIRFGNIFE